MTSTKPSSTAKTVSTRSDLAAAYDHFVQNVAGLQSDNDIVKALNLYGLKSLPDLMDMERSDIDSLEYADSAGDMKPLHHGGQGCVRVMQAYFQYLRENGIDDIMSLTMENFNDYRMDIYDPNATQPSTTSSKAKRPTSSTHTCQPAEDFKKGIKRDKSHYIVLKENKQWDHWRRTTLATACSHACEEVFDPNYNPTTTENKDLFDEKKKFIYSVFNDCLQTDVGKSLVRTHERNYDAQTIYKELKAHATASTQATLDTDELLSYVTSTKLNKGQWRGTHHAFILHWCD